MTRATVDVEALRRLVEGLQRGSSLWMTRADLLVLIDQRDRYAEDALGFMAAADSLSEQLAVATRRAEAAERVATAAAAFWEEVRGTRYAENPVYFADELVPLREALEAFAALTPTQEAPTDGS